MTKQLSVIGNSVAVSLALAADQKGILPDHMIAALVREGAIRAGRELDADQIQPASLDLRLGEVAYRVRASFLPGPDTTVARAHRRIEAARDRAHRRRRAGDRLRLHRAAAREPRAARRHRGRRQSEKLDRPARRLHPRDRRRDARLRPHRGRLSRPALRRDQPAHVSGAGARGLAALADPLPPRRRAARRARRCARCTRASAWSTTTRPT